VQSGVRHRIFLSYFLVLAAPPHERSLKKTNPMMLEASYEGFQLQKSMNDRF
jgi:hypothetical protein